MARIPASQSLYGSVLNILTVGGTIIVDGQLVTFEEVGDVLCDVLDVPIIVKSVVMMRSLAVVAAPPALLTPYFCQSLSICFPFLLPTLFVVQPGSHPPGHALGLGQNVACLQGWFNIYSTSLARRASFSCAHGQPHTSPLP